MSLATGFGNYYCAQLIGALLGGVAPTLPATWHGALLTVDATDDDGIVFAGGTLVREPMCVELTVKVDDSPEVVNVGAGAPCDGPQPPP